MKEITEGLKPIKEGIKNLPQAITFPPTQPIGEASKEEEEEQEEEELIGEIAKKYLNRPNPDTTFGIRDEKGLYYVGNKQAIIFRNNIITDDEKFEGTPGLWELITYKNPQEPIDKEDKENYKRLILKTKALHRDNNPKSPYPKSSRGKKWRVFLKPIWERYKKKEEYEGEGAIVIPSDPNTLLERLDLLLACQKAGHTGVRNKLVSICDELKRQGFLDTKAYKKLNSLNKK